LLRQITALLQPLVRDSDTLARLGGDEFGAFLENCTPDSAVRIAEKLRQTICDFHFVWQDKIFPIGVSIGLVNFNSDALSLPDLLSAADAACYIAKDTGRNRVHIYRAEDHQLAQNQGEIKWNERIQKAFENDGFCLYSQEIVNIRRDNGSFFFDELRLYMTDDAGRLIPTTAFIPAAERYHYMPTIDRWVIRTVFAQQAASLLKSDSDLHVLLIKISGSSLDDETFIDFVREQFIHFALPYDTICFAIAETTAITNLTRALSFIDTLKPLGCRFALDDFGSGMSSFTYLKHLDVDFLKIDGGYIQGMESDPVDFAKIEAIQHISNVMGIKTIAPNVDSDAILKKLRSIGISYVQGSALHPKKPFYPPLDGK